MENGKRLDVSNVVLETKNALAVIFLLSYRRYGVDFYQGLSGVMHLMQVVWILTQHSSNLLIALIAALQIKPPIVPWSALAEESYITAVLSCLFSIQARTWDTASPRNVLQTVLRQT